MLDPGTRLGPYEILSVVGAGGMGQVYRARDSRLERDVAVKVLRAASRPEDLRRLEREARAAGSLNHPAILAVFDTGEFRGAPFIVSELLEGETLRERLRQGPLPVRKALEIGAQVAHGLAAAHEKGIVHRDLKPENLFLTRDGRAKILDFGLAKVAPRAGDAAESSTGAVVGTTGYMSPEQVSGGEIDARSDLFALGSLLYEMVTGERAFRRSSPAETLLAVLRDDPPPSDRIPPALDRVVHRCLEKRPEDRFSSARDVAFSLEALSSSSTDGDLSRPSRRSLRLPRLRPPSSPWALLAALLGGAILGGLAMHRPSDAPRYRRLTFRKGWITEARFLPDGRMVYSAAWNGAPSRVYVQALDEPDGRELETGPAQLLSVSSTGTLALLLRPHRVTPLLETGTLALAPLMGSAPRELLENVQGADFSPDGSRLALIRDADGRSVLEVRELGSGAEGVGDARVLHVEPYGFLSRPRFSPRGDRVAVLSHAYREGGEARILVADLAGAVTEVAPPGSTHVFARPVWTADGREIWFGDGDLRAARLEGPPRRVGPVRAPLFLRDRAPDGTLLAEDGEITMSLRCGAPGEAEERDLSWLNWTRGMDLSPDGRQVLFQEYGARRNLAAVRDLAGGPPVRLGEGEPKAFSPDGRSVLVEAQMSPPRLSILPLGAGEARPLAAGSLERISFAAFVAGGDRVVFTGTEAGHGVRLWVQDVSGGAPRPASPEGLAFTVVAPHPAGDRAAVVGPDGLIQIQPLDGSPAQKVPGAKPGDQPIRFTADGALWVFPFGPVPTPVRRIDLATGEARVMRTVGPLDPAGVLYVAPRLLSADGGTYCYQALRVQSRLYTVEGLR